MVKPLILAGIEAVNFRSYSRVEVSFQPGLNFIVGANASGKSNLLEAVAFLGYARSFRWHEDRMLLKWGETAFALTGRVTAGLNNLNLRITYTPGKKEALINEESHRLSDYLGHYPVVTFSPDDLYLIKGPPALRRQFLDRELCQIDRSYCQSLRQYRHVLLQRNRLLKLISLGQAQAAELQPWNEQLISVGMSITNRRRELVAALAATARQLYQAFNRTSGELSISYHAQAEDAAGFRQLLGRGLAAEVSSRTTLYGPHRDDISFNLNGHDMRYGASQGQQRSALLTLKLAEVDYFTSLTRVKPGIIFDDVSVRTGYS